MTEQLRFRTSNIDVEVGYKKAGNKLLVPKPQITMRADGLVVSQERTVEERKFLWRGKEVKAEVTFRDPETGETVKDSEVIELLLRYAYRYLNPNGVEAKGRDIRYFAMQPDGSEAEVQPFSRTTIIDVPEENWVPAANVDGFLYTSVYELFPKMSKGEVVSEKDLVALWREAELRWKKDQVGITTFSWGNGFIQYYAFLCPVVREGKFGWIMKLSDTQVEYNYLQDIPEKVEVKEVPTLKTLPPVQALVVTAKSK